MRLRTPHFQIISAILGGEGITLGFGKLVSILVKTKYVGNQGPRPQKKLAEWGRPGQWLKEKWYMNFD